VTNQVSSPARRALLGRALGLLTLAGMSTFGGSLFARSAEAACGGCGSCPSVYLWLGCSATCCADYYVYDRENCDSGCTYCGNDRTEQHCGVIDCC
jgi:hypothetical protein